MHSINFYVVVSENWWTIPFLFHLCWLNVFLCSVRTLSKPRCWLLGSLSFISLLFIFLVELFWLVLHYMLVLLSYALSLSPPIQTQKRHKNLHFFFFLIICNNIKLNKENKEGNPHYKKTLKQQGDYHYWKRTDMRLEQIWQFHVLLCCLIS